MSKIYLFIALVLVLASCGKRVVSVETERVRIEYKDRIQHTRDSIYLHDSIYLEKRGDTIVRERYRTKTKLLTRHDTLYIERRDSIRYPVVVEVERPRSWFERMETNAYRIVIALLLIFIGWYSLRRVLGHYIKL